MGVGMAKAAAISSRLGFCDPKTLERVRSLIVQAGLPVEVPGGISLQDLIQGMEVDKKSAGGKVKFVMCAGIGKAHFHSLAPQEIIAALEA